MKICLGCKQNLHLDDFGTDHSRMDGKNAYCKRCNNDKAREMRGDNRLDGFTAHESPAQYTLSERAIQRNRLKREREERIAQLLRDEPERELPENCESVFSGISLGFLRVGNHRVHGWSCPVGVTSR